MSRFITILLLLIVFFFGGMSYGSFEKDRLKEQPAKEEQSIEQESIVDTTAVISDTTPELEENDYIVHRTASFFEKIVTAVYEGIITILYKIANLFFD